MSAIGDSTNRRFFPIPLDQYDASIHELPVAYKPIRAGDMLTLVIGDDTFTAEPAMGYYDAIALKDAAVGEDVLPLISGTVTVTASAALSPSGDVYFPSASDPAPDYARELAERFKPMPQMIGVLARVTS